MSDYLAIDRESGQLNGFEASVSKDSVRLRSAFTLTIPDDAQLADDAGVVLNADGKLADAERTRLLGGWLRTQLRELNISTKQALLCLPREETVVRQLDVPDVPDHELTDIVRLQAETKTSTSLDKLLLDYVPLTKRPDQLGREVLLATVSRKFADRVTDMFRTAELEPVAMGMSSVATAEIVARAEKGRGLPSDEPSLVLSRHGNRVEISLISSGELLFTHAGQLHVDSEEQAIKAALAEVSRSLMAMQRVLGGRKIARGWVIGPAEEVKSLCEGLQDRVPWPVEPLEPITELGIRLDNPAADANEARFAGPLGMLLAQSGAMAAQLDFLNPRKPVKRIDQDQLRLVIAGCAAAILLIIGVGWAKAYEGSLEKERVDLAARKAQLSSTFFRGRPTMDSARMIDDWKRVDVNLLDQMNLLNNAFPGTGRVYFTEFRFTGGRGASRLSIKAAGNAVDRQDVESLMQQLADMKYRVKPMSPKKGSKDPKYSYPFELELEFLEATDIADSQGAKTTAPKK